MRANGLSISIGLLAGGFLCGGLVAPRALQELERSADLIVVGSASADITAGSTSASFPLEVTRVIKGDPAIAGTSVLVSWTSSSGLMSGMLSPAGSHFRDRGTGLWFLRRSSNEWLLVPVVDGGITFQDTYFPVPPGPIASAYTYGPAADLADKIASELAAALEADHPHSLALDSLHYTLDKSGSPVLQIFYQRMSTSASAQQRILGLNGLIRGGRASALSSAASQAAEFEGYPLENGILLSAIRDEFRAGDANSITTLGGAAVDSAKPAAFRQAAAHALASIHTLEALPYLAALLDASEGKLRVEAIGGLGSFANGVPVQTTANTPGLASLQVTGSAPLKTADTIANFALGEQAISRHEAAYLAFWKSWWAAHRASLGY